MPDELGAIARTGPRRLPAGSARVEPVRVLHIPYTYFPDPPGGTEVYVAGLVGGLRRAAAGIGGAVAAPAAGEREYEYDGTPVYRFAAGGGAALAQAYGAPDLGAAQSFAAVLARVRPDIVHLHARSAAVSERLVDCAREIGAKVVFTYHTPTVSCARGTMLHLGRSPCDGVLDRRRCTACVLAGHGVPAPLRGLLARTPEPVGCGLARAGLAGGAFTALRLPALIGAAQRRFHALMRKADRVVAVCGWVRDVLLANGVAASKLVLCRHGLPVRSPPPPPPSPPAAGPLRLGYFGRLDPVKGADLLVEALRRLPDAPVRLDLFGVTQPGGEAYAAALERAAAADPRVALRPALAPGEVAAAMRRCDLVAVPSRGMETGPLVVLEAFAAGTPVLGSRLGGIAELVADGVDGILVEPASPAAWASALAALLGAPERLARLRRGIRPPRTMDDVAGEMAALYRAVLAA